jgi:hypothetical protein
MVVTACQSMATDKIMNRNAKLWSRIEGSLLVGACYQWTWDGRTKIEPGRSAFFEHSGFKKVAVRMHTFH